MFITGLGTAVPPNCFTQAQCWEALQSWSGLKGLAPRSIAILKKVLRGGNGIATRHLAVRALEDFFASSPDVLHARFLAHAPLLAVQAAERALQGAGLNAREVDGLLVSTCTGYLCPGLTSYVAERLGLRSDVLALDLVGQGCGAALPNLRMGEALIASNRCERILSVCVEVCSAAFYLDDDPGVLISACLFGDGAGAAVLAPKPAARGRRIEWKSAGTVLNPGQRDVLRFEQRGGMLRNVLMPCVPVLAAEHAERVFRDVARRTEIKRKEIAAWIFHAGGRDVLSALRERFGLDEAELSWSADVLRAVGNISSPFVYHVLERALAKGAPSGRWWMSSFGAGFSCHGALLEVE